MVELPLLKEANLPSTPPEGAVRLAAIQMEPRLGKTEHNLAATVEAMDRAAKLGASLVVFPECSLTGYCFSNAAEAREYAVATEGPVPERLAEACAVNGQTVVVGYIERTGTGLANAAAVVSGGGVLEVYRKTHLPHLGVDRWVEAGCGPLRPIAVGDLKLGVLICYDGSFPEASRTLALRGADLIVLPTNWPAEAVVKADWLPNTRAYENVVYYAAVNRIGTERSFEFHGKSRICAPTGDTLVQGPTDAPALMVADVILETARTKKILRRGEDYWVDRIGQRREDLYGV